MINAIKFLKATGDILGSLQLNGEYDLTAYDSNDIGCIQADIDLNDTTWYVLNGALATRPEKPSIYHLWNGSEWIADNSYLANDIRLNRNELLAQSDWTDTYSAPTRLGEAKYNEWQVYRQALRDITLQPEFPTNVIYPIVPT